MMTNTSDEIYIDRVLQGDCNAFGFLVERYKDLVFTLVLKLVRNREDAEELAQDTFIKAYYSLDTFKRKSRFSTWLYRIAFNASISKLRKNNPSKVEMQVEILPDGPEMQEPDDFHGLDFREQQALISQTLDKMNPEESFLVTLYYFEDCSLGDIAEVTGQPAANIKVKLHRIRRKMFSIMEQLMPVLTN